MLKLNREMNNLLRCCLCLLLALLLNACASDKVPLGSGNTDSLSNMQSLTPNAAVPANSKPDSDDARDNSIRLQALQETALSVGAQGGLAWRAEQINSILDLHAKALSSIYNFNLLMLPQNVQPPVLEQGSNSLNLADDNSIRIADKTYQIISQARFVTTPPDWRQYLYLNYAKPDRPDDTLLPETLTEVALWRKYVTEGWEEGIEQANQIYTVNLARLKRDYQGMMLYRVLLAQKMVSAPFVATTNLGVTGDNNNLRINDQVLRITALPALQLNSKHWKPAITNDQQ